MTSRTSTHLSNHFKMSAIEQGLDVAARTGKEIVDSDDDGFSRHKALAQMGAEKAAPPVISTRSSMCIVSLPCCGGLPPRKSDRC
jgi:hypothetical protein